MPAAAPACPYCPSPVHHADPNAARPIAHHRRGMCVEHFPSAFFCCSRAPSALDHSSPLRFPSSLLPKHPKQHHCPFLHSDEPLSAVDRCLQPHNVHDNTLSNCSVAYSSFFAPPRRQTVAEPTRITPAQVRESSLEGYLVLQTV
jgi:hypothetical protein